ncbi:MAG TPA: glycosyltransferase family 39 protein [Vitreimonas sp.]|uniref:glycosyltransferase family 39 protein n=1 Tax=Vitreimonas sp. TaxID=3069702 RepID=UPI002D5CF8EB|nr:glycosyltransferase family 39 protein [Vitreimonas sp.]HYD86145.1 glycosyltransferase family 39 protein [Vitreimonas sp.]
MTSFLARTLERPERALWMLIAAQFAFWSLAPLLSHSAPPLDVVDEYATGREGVVAIFKHPNLPGLVLEGVRLITGAAGWPAYFVSQVFIVVTFAAVYALGRDLMDARRALIGTALLTGVYFFSWPSPEFNHNVAQMPFWALTALALWKATTRGGLGWWILLGLAAGLSLWAKYSSAILLLMAGVWMLHDRQARRKLLTPGPWITALVTAAVFAPQVLWLFEHDFQPFAYAARRSTSVEFVDTLGFLPIQLAHHIPMFVLMLCAGLFGKRAEDAPQVPDKRALRYLLIMGLGPPVVLTLIGLVSVSGLRTAWGAPMFNLSGLLAAALLTQRIDARRARGTLIGALVVILFTSGLYFGHMRYGYQLTGKPLRGNWPQAEIDAAMQEQWRTATGGAPLRIVAGDIWSTGLVGLNERNPPSVLINADYEISPWLTPEDVARDGALVVWSGAEPWGLDSLLGDRPRNEMSFLPNRPNAKTRPVTMYYAIIPPAGERPRQ